MVLLKEYHLGVQRDLKISGCSFYYPNTSLLQLGIGVFPKCLNWKNKYMEKGVKSIENAFTE